ncbi:hypothetical protein Hs30E_10600 [Lactococcus hodotermopsidis]|uniref:Tubulin like n=1 Tax=Pseudolactococcus hodotermopsidis TaxID=2709157 RepID=A0A6A0BAR3_9LACT|nr:tubulin-like doman-containing protein [Lactococcus hodotermopsidis]GFH42509.1 hypothetical protein Hs30E_10600 [Lactococcus hodotermopsidis]
MYQKLLLTCEGGIIDATQQSEQDNCAVVCIGLGGTGVDCLKNLKAKIYNRVKPDNPDSAVPVYSHIKFLAVDTDKNGMEHANEESADISKIDLDTEFFDLSYGGAINELFKENGPMLDNKPEYKEWLRYKDIKALSSKAGASGIRQLGRYFLMERAQDFAIKIISLVNEAKSGLKRPKTYVHIFSGLSGGTGAGTFLDVCYLVQEALKRENDGSFICGYFFLPDVNIAAGLDRETEANVQVNGYASLQDLDYCMNFESNGDKWSQNYSGIGLVESQKPPVDICHLVSARDANGNVIKGAYKYAMNVVTDYFMDFVVKTNNNFTMESHISNFTTKKAQVDKGYGGLYEYCVLGASNATLPFKEVLTYLASKMFERFGDIRKYNPTKAQVEEFIAKNGLRYDALFTQLTQNCDMGFPRPDVKWQDAKGNDDLTVTFFKDHQARLKQFLERNFVALTKDLENYNPVAENTSNAARSLVSKIYTALRVIATDPERGPYFAAAVLRSTAGSDLIATIDGYLAEVQSKYEQENVQEEKLQRAWEQAQRDFFENSNAFNGKKKYVKYRDATRLLVIHDTRLIVFSKMQDLLARLRKQLTDLASNFMDVFRNTIGSLIDTFAANREYLDSLSDSVSTFEFPLAQIKDLKANLNLTIKEMDVPAKATDFLTNMLSEEGINAWINGNENEIFTIVNRYFTALFSLYSQKTMTSYLQDKYNTTDANQLIKRIRDDIMNTLDGHATPLFWTSSVYNVNAASKIGYITFPAVSEEVSQAAQQLSDSKAPGELTPRNSHIQDRISIMRCLVGVPLFGYQGLLQYENNSVKDNSVGKHLYEGKNFTNDSGEYVVGRDWRYLPSPTAYSLMNAQNCSILKDAADVASKLYEEAEAKKIIAPIDGNNFGIHLIAESFIKEIHRIQVEVAGKTKVEQLEAIDQINALLANIQFEPDKILIPNDATASLPEINKRLVRIDHFISSPRLQEVVEAEVAKMREIEAVLSGLKPKDDSDLINFQNALFTGAITFTPPVVECEDEFGTKYTLSSPDMKRGGVPLYQAFISFKELEADVRDAFKESAEQTLKALPLREEAVETSRAVWKELKDLKFLIQEAAEAFPSEIGELKEYLANMKGTLSRFSRKYRFDLD